MPLWLNVVRKTRLGNNLMYKKESAISVILPTYNEADTILQLIELIEHQLSAVNHEIVVVDDNSPDGTSDTVRQAMNRFQNLRLITRTDDKGLIPSIREGIKMSSGDICIWMDADLSMSPSLIKPLLDKIYAGADMAVGSRFINGGGMKGYDGDGAKTPLHKIWKSLKGTEDSFYVAMISKAGNWLLRNILDTSFHDYTSGYYAVRKELFNSVALEGKYADYCISLAYSAIMKGFKVVEIPMVMIPRKMGKSKTSNSLLSILGISYDCLKMAISLRWRKAKGKFK